MQVPLLRLSILFLVVFAVHTAQALAVEAGERHRGRFELLGRQVPLPEGEWSVVGRGHNTLTSGNPGAYGTIENLILARHDGGRVDALVEVNVNRLQVSGGWGTAHDCTRDDSLARVSFYKTPIDGFCLFVVPTALGEPTAPGPAAWTGARAMLHQGGPPPRRPG